jgi:plastocyanin
MRVSGLKAFGVGFALVGLLSCGGDGGTNNPAGPGNPQTGTQTLTITILGDRGNLSFSPNPAIAGGMLVVFRNADNVAHRVRLNDLTLDWGVIQPGATSAAIRMPAEGSHYHCNIHPAMIGAVASDATTPPPACRGDYC